jgi:hypothetical protein
MKKPAVGQIDKLRALTEDPELGALMEQYEAASAVEGEPILKAFVETADVRHPGWRETFERAEHDGVILRALFIASLKEARARRGLTERDQLEMVELEAEFLMHSEVFSLTAAVSATAQGAIRLASVVQKMEMIARLGLEEAEKRKRRAMSDGGRDGGTNSGKARARENKPWAPHATELARAIYSELPNASNEKVAVEIVSGWKLETPLPPTVRTLEKFVSELRKARKLPKRAK